VAQSGFTLIEALIAAVILAIGVLGVVSLLTMSKVAQHEGIQRVRAIALADDMLERMRRNPAGTANYNTGLTSPLGNASISTPPADCNAAMCTPEEVANRDLWAWEQLLDGRSITFDDGGTPTPALGMRNVRGCIEFTADAGKNNTGIFDVIVQWQGLQETSDAVASGGISCGAAGAEDRTWRQVVVSSYAMDELE
jgi:type IV pilus assembly protein PilV